MKINMSPMFNEKNVRCPFRAAATIPVPYPLLPEPTQKPDAFASGFLPPGNYRPVAWPVSCIWLAFFCCALRQAYMISATAMTP